MFIKWSRVNLEQWERRETFLGFKDFDFPYSVVGTEIEITPSFRFWKEKQFSPFLSMVYAVCSAANAVPAFRQRIRGDELIEHERVHADFTVPKGKESFTIKLVEFSPHFLEFYSRATDASAVGWSTPGNDDPHNDHWIYMSCMPWVRFNHIVQPVDRRSGSIPRIVWGRFAERDGKVMLPVSVQVHHSMVDGLHMAQFLERLEELLNQPQTTFV